MNDKFSLSVILPVYNEEVALKPVVRGIADFLQKNSEFERYEIIAVEDGSSDRSGDILREMEKEIFCLRVLYHEYNLGYGAALSSGFKIARYPLLLCMDADGQFDISDLETMADFLKDYDAVIGYREGRKDNLYRIIVGKAYNFLACLLFGERFKDINCGFKLFKRELIGETDFKSHAGVFYTELLFMARSRKCKIKQAPVRHFPRSTGKSTGASPLVIRRAIADLIWLFKHRVSFSLKEVGE